MFTVDVKQQCNNAILSNTQNAILKQPEVKEPLQNGRKSCSVPKHLTISLVIRQDFFFLPKQSQKFRSILYDGSRSLGLFRKGKSLIIAKIHRTDSFTCIHSREGKPSLIAE